MKYILTFLFCFGVAYAQEPTYTPMKGSYRYKTIRVDSLFLVPSFTDTTAANATNIDAVAGAMIRTGNDFWMRNASLSAWLQNVNVGNGASPAVGYVDSLKRKADSVFMKKSGTWIFAFKDSIPRPDGPDRIDGMATGKVISDMQGYTYEIQNSDKVYYNIDSFQLIIKDKYNLLTPYYFSRFGSNEGLDIYGYPNYIEFKRGSGSSATLFKIDTIGNINIGVSGANMNVLGGTKVINAKADTFHITGLTRLSDLSDGIVIADVDGNLAINQKNWYGDNNVALATQDYTATMPGVYTVTTGDVSSSYYFNLPSPADCQGRSLTIFNTDATYSTPVTTPTGNIYEDASAVTITQIPSGKAVTLMSDGTNWRSTFKTF